MVTLVRNKTHNRYVFDLINKQLLPNFWKKKEIKKSCIKTCIYSHSSLNPLYEAQQTFNLSASQSIAGLAGCPKTNWEIKCVQLKK